MSSLMSEQINYFPTESDLAELFAKAGLPQDFSNKFIKDYAAIKRNVDQNAEATDDNTADIEVVAAELGEVSYRLTLAEFEIISIGVRLTTAEGEIDTLRIDLDQLRLEFDAHVADQSAHGATGDIVGTDDYATALVGGTVLLAAAVTDAIASTVSVTSPDATAAPAAYNQTQAQSVVTLANEMKGDINTLVTNLNSVVTQLNALLASERAAKQLAP